MRAKGRDYKETKDDEFKRRAANGAEDSYIREHQTSHNRIKRCWFKAAAYRHTPIEVGGTN